MLQLFFTGNLHNATNDIQSKHFEGKKEQKSNKTKEETTEREKKQQHIL